jgi:hypothetical protein
MTPEISSVAGLRCAHAWRLILPWEPRIGVIRQEGDSARIWLLGGVQVGSGVSEALGAFVATGATVYGLRF